MDRKYQAGVWEQGRGLVVWSSHGTEALAAAAARRYARQLRGASSGGALTWAGGWRQDGASVHWIGADGKPAPSESVE